MIGVYIRVSSYSQKTNSQKAEITRWLNNHGHDLTRVQWFEDQETGTTLKRPGFQQLQTAIFQGQVKMVLVWKLDRLARNLQEGINLLSDWCEKGVRVVSVTQQIDLSGTLGQMVAGVLFAFAEIELQHTKERQAAGIALAKKKGLYQGRQKGTTKARPKQALELKEKGLTVSEIARVLQVSERTVFRYLGKF